MDEVKRTELIQALDEAVSRMRLNDPDAAWHYLRWVYELMMRLGYELDRCSFRD